MLQLLRSTARRLPPDVVLSIGGAAKRLLPRRLILGLYRAGYGDRLVGMTSAAEQAFYTECAHSLRDRGPAGAVVDLGCWMGATAISLARGLATPGDGCPQPDRRVYAFDRFIWVSTMDKYLPIVEGDYTPGDSFLPEVRRRIEPFSDTVELVETDLHEFVWGEGPISLLLVDAMKSGDLAQSIVASFYPSLAEGSVLIHQDYKHYYTSWIHVVQYRLREYFRLEHEVREGGSVAFKALRPIPAHEAATAGDLAQVSDPEANAAMAYSAGLVGESGQEAIAAAHVMHFVHAGRLAEAGRTLGDYLTRGVSPRGELGLAERELRIALSVA